MACRFHYSLNELVKADETIYLMTAAHKRKKRTREEIIKQEKNLFPSNPEEEVMKLYGLSFSEYVNRLVEIEEKTFGDKDSAFVLGGYRATTEPNLEKNRKYLEKLMRSFHGIEAKQWKIIHTEIKDSTTDAKRELFSMCGINFVEYEGPPKEEWMIMVNNFVELAKKQSFVSEVDLVGSLARGRDHCKDADIIMSVNPCPVVIPESPFVVPNFGVCAIYREMMEPDSSLKKRMMIVGEGGIIFPIDLYCLNEEEFKELEGNYKIARGKKILFRKI